MSAPIPLVTTSLQTFLAPWSRQHLCAMPRVVSLPRNKRFQFIASAYGISVATLSYYRSPCTQFALSSAHCAAQTFALSGAHNKAVGWPASLLSQHSSTHLSTAVCVAWPVAIYLPYCLVLDAVLPLNSRFSVPSSRAQGCPRLPYSPSSSSAALARAHIFGSDDSIQITLSISLSHHERCTKCVKKLEACSSIHASSNLSARHSSSLQGVILGSKEILTSGVSGVF